MKKTTFSLLAASSLFLASLPNLAFAENQTDIDITINQSLTLTLGKTALELQAGPDLNTDYMTITGSTNSQAGFAISFNVNNPYNDLKHENAAIRESIPSLTEDKTAAEFPETAWGYTLEAENQTFKKIPLTSENIFSTEENGQGTYNFGLGVKVAANQTAGSYENELIFTIVANPIPPKTISRIKTMQEITPEICSASAEHETVQLKDIRDNKTYWVTKLKDNNCWMTQNLDYDLSVAANQTLTPATSNVTANRTVVPANTDLTTFKADDVIYYLDGGDTYYANGTTKTEGYSSLPEDSIDRHYAQGDYYSWRAATAGQGTTDIAGADVNESICPAGWRLPTADPVNSGTANYGFGNLIKQYGYTGTNQMFSASDATLLASPLFFARGGYVNSSGSLVNQGDSGFYWSSRADSNSNSTYRLLFNDLSNVLPSYIDIFNRNHSGYSVRCVAQAKDLSSISTMQEMTPEIVSKTPVDTSKQLTDTRDGKKYWVTKLKDGNIWMTQNLDYDLSVVANQTLTPATSNVTENRTVVPANTDLATFASDDNSVYYLDGGDTYYANGTTKTEGLSTLPADSTDRHYTQGDYYSWKAATAGQGTTSITTEQDVNESICPAGWRLPTSNSADANYSFGNLVKQYGYTGTNGSASEATLLASPLFFARGGEVYSGSLRLQGSDSYYWSSRASSNSNYAYSLYFGGSYVYPSLNYYRYSGLSVRCVAL